MPKIADHPRASLARTLELASAVEELGGECSVGAAASRLGARPGGTFGALVSTAAKFGWIAIRRGRLRTEGRYRDYRLAYDEAARRAALVDAIRSVPLFRQLMDRFGGKTLPEDHLPKLLVREFGVPESAATKVAGYFTEAVLEAGLLAGARLGTAPEPEATSHRPRTAGASVTRDGHGTVPNRDTHRRGYRVHVTGPDVDTAFELAEPEDLDLLRAVLSKVERGLRTVARGRTR